MHCGIRPQPRPDMVAATELQKGEPNCLETPGFVPSQPVQTAPLPLAGGVGVGVHESKACHSAKLIAELSV
ncbi:hypothetical protein I8G32_02805 [Rhodopseudomonas palustris]|nr:hypothetical protein I8G32_02805 [Rhodopseudomonas palustris]